MNINTELSYALYPHFRSMALEQLQQYQARTIFLTISIRAACVKEFELILEQSGSLLKRRLRPYSSPIIGRQIVSLSKICSATL